MNVVECEVPSGSMLSRELIERAYFHDSYRMPLSRRELNIVDIFFGIFAHHPLRMKLLLIVRNKVASLAGLDAPTGRVDEDVAILIPQSGRIEARIGLRMMPTFPRPSLSFRTAGFPRYGWKVGLSDGAF